MTSKQDINSGIQQGIVEYLRGQKIQIVEQLSEDMLWSRSSPLSGEAELDFMKSFLVHQSIRKMKKNGLDAESICLNCSKFNCEAVNFANHSYHESMSTVVSLRVVMSCDIGGCNRARENFIQEFKALEERGEAQIAIDVSRFEQREISHHALGHSMFSHAIEQSQASNIVISHRERMPLDDFAFEDRRRKKQNFADEQLRQEMIKLAEEQPHEYEVELW